MDAGALTPGGPHQPTGWPWQTALTWLKRRIDTLPLIT
jgi:hypothetical protein